MSSLLSTIGHKFVDKQQQIVTVSFEPMPEPRVKSRTPVEFKGTRNQTRLWISQEHNRLLTGVRKFGIGIGSTW
jgi:hypothetical protein